MIEQPNRVEALLIRVARLFDDGRDAALGMQQYADFHALCVVHNTSMGEHNSFMTRRQLLRTWGADRAYGVQSIGIKRPGDPRPI